MKKLFILLTLGIFLQSCDTHYRYISNDDMEALIDAQEVTRITPNLIITKDSILYRYDFDILNWQRVITP